MKSHRLINPFLAIIAGLGIVLALPALAASGPNAGKEIKTAVEHAGFAMKSKSTGDVHKHLHHVINCLVGTNGEDFDATVGNAKAALSQVDKLLGGDGK